MFEYIEHIQGNVLAIRITAEITEKEHQKIDGLISRRFSEQGRLRMLIVVKHYPSLSSAEALYEDLRMVKLHAEHIERLAVVGDRPWKRTWVGLFGLFGGIQCDYFEMNRINAAWDWITEGLAQTVAP